MQEGFNRVEAGLNRVENRMEEGFNRVEYRLNRVDNRLDIISEQLAYLYLLVEDSHQKQKSLAKAISHLHQAMLIKEIAALKAELYDRSRFPEESPRSAIKTASSGGLKNSLVLFERTLALRQGFQPLPDYRFYVKFTLMGSAVSLQLMPVGKRQCRVLRFYHL